MGRLKKHPDLGGTATAAVLINEAYHTLNHPKKKADYDRQLFEKLSKRSVSGIREQGSVKSKACPACEENTDIASAFLGGGQCPVCGKLISKKPEHPSNTSEKRNVNRLQKSGILTYQYPQSEKRYTGKVIDLSSKGVRFISKEKMSRTTELKIESPLLKGTARITNCREARWQNRSIYFVGAHFTTVEFHRPCGTFLSIKV
jgi:curved DNA-binding protein CbpA